MLLGNQSSCSAASGVNSTFAMWILSLPLPACQCSSRWFRLIPSRSRLHRLFLGARRLARHFFGDERVHYQLADVIENHRHHRQRVALEVDVEQIEGDRQGLLTAGEGDGELIAAV